MNCPVSPLGQSGGAFSKFVQFLNESLGSAEPRQSYVRVKLPSRAYNLRGKAIPDVSWYPC